MVGFLLVLRYIPNIRETEIHALDLRGFLLSGIGLSVLVLGLSMLGRHLVSGEIPAACIIAGVLALGAYAWHARRTEHPLINLNLLKLATFNTGVVGGGLFRIGVGATPFLLPLMLQLGFGLNPFQSGLLTCASAMGAMFMKTLTVRILKRYGFRTVLTANAVLASCATAGYGLFSASTPHFVLIAVLLFSGCLRSLQFTGLNAITFADVSRQTMSQATSLSSMAQRLCQSMGVVIAAFCGASGKHPARTRRHRGVGFLAGVPGHRRDIRRLAVLSPAPARRCRRGGIGTCNGGQIAAAETAFNSPLS